MYFSNRRLTIYFNGRTKAVSWRKHVRVLKQRCVCLIASNLLRNELGFFKTKPRKDQFYSIRYDIRFHSWDDLSSFMAL